MVLIDKLLIVLCVLLSSLNLSANLRCIGVDGLDTNVSHSLAPLFSIPLSGTSFQPNNFQKTVSWDFVNENNSPFVRSQFLRKPKHFMEINFRYETRNHRDRKKQFRVIFKICYNKQEMLMKALVLLILICGDVHVNPGPARNATSILGDINVASWNVRTLLNDTCTDYRRTAVIGRELSRHNIDIAALCETRISGIDQELVELGAGYTFFTTGKPVTEPRLHGVGFAIKNTLLKELGDQKPCGINHRLSYMKIKLAHSRYITIVSAYAPTMKSSEEDKDEFYEDLGTLLSSMYTCEPESATSRRLQCQGWQRPQYLEKSLGQTWHWYNECKCKRGSPSILLCRAWFGHHQYYVPASQ